MGFRKLSRSRAALVAAAAVMIALAGCSSSDDSGNDEGDGSGSGPTTTLKIASVTTEQYFGADIPLGVKTRLDLANANNEVPGYKFEYLGVIDDKGTPDGTVAAYREAKEKDGAFAVVGAISNQNPTDYVNQAQLPVVASAIGDSYCTHGADTTWYWFSVTGCGLGVGNPYGTNLGQGIGDIIGSLDGKTAGCVGEDFPGMDENIKKLCASFTAAGADVVETDPTIPAPPAVVSDYSPWVQKMMTANDGDPVDVVGLGTSPGGSAGMASGLLNAGYKGVIVAGAGYSSQQTQMMNGVTLHVDSATPLSAGTTPAMQEIMDSFKAAGATDDQVDSPAIGGWLAADMFLKVLEKTGPGASAEDFAKAASDFTYELEGVAGPTTYPIAFAAPTPCSEYIQSDGTAWTVVRPYTCDQVFVTGDTSFVDYDSVDPDQKY